MAIPQGALPVSRFWIASARAWVSFPVSVAAGGTVTITVDHTAGANAVRLAVNVVGGVVAVYWLDLGMAAALTQKAVIAGGMLPKLQACKDALLHGVNRVRISPAAEVEALPEFYVSKIESGTEVLVA